MEIFLAIIGGIIGFSLIEKYQYKVGGWGNAYAIYVLILLSLLIIYNLLIK